MTYEELNSLEGTHPITCDECPFASIELCKNQCLEIEERKPI